MQKAASLCDGIQSTITTTTTIEWKDHRDLMLVVSYLKPQMTASLPLPWNAASRAAASRAAAACSVLLCCVLCCVLCCLLRCVLLY